MDYNELYLTIAIPEYISRCYISNDDGYVKSQPISTPILKLEIIFNQIKKLIWIKSNNCECFNL